MSAQDAQALAGENSVFGDPPGNPLTALRMWFDEAVEREVLEPAALALATAGRDGLASNRIVRLLEIRDGELIFTSCARSQKGREIAATGWACGVLYWRETKQQIVASGPIAPLAAHESDALWGKRPAQIQAMSIASEQGAVLCDENELRVKAQRLAHKHGSLPRPEDWVGYALAPKFIEFWRWSQDGLHQRLRYEAAAEGWRSFRLQP